MRDDEICYSVSASDVRITLVPLVERPVDFRPQNEINTNDTIICYPLDGFGKT